MKCATQRFIFRFKDHQLSELVSCCLVLYCNFVATFLAEQDLVGMAKELKTPYFPISPRVKCELKTTHRESRKQHGTERRLVQHRLLMIFNSRCVSAFGSCQARSNEIVNPSVFQKNCEV